MHEYQAIIEQVALYLGRPWKFNHLEQESCWQRQIIDGQGHALIISRQYNSERFKISGRFDPRFTEPMHSDYHSIGVSFTRHPKAIAADIQRRLLPNYLEAYDQARQRYIENQAKLEHINNVAHLISKASNGLIISDSSGSTQKRICFPNGEMTLYGSSEEISLSLHSLSVEDVIKMLAILKDNR